MSKIEQLKHSNATASDKQSGTKVLRLTTSILGEASVSTSLIDGLVERLSAVVGALDVVERNFGKTPIPHFDGEWLTAIMTPEADRSDAQQRKAAFSKELITELQNADVVVIALPMYNFSVPSMLKAWNDHVARAGETFKYTDKGSVGLLNDKKVFLVTAMGGQHEPGKTDFLRPYMRHFLGFLGLKDITFITASGLSMGDEPRAAGLASAEAEIDAAIEQLKRDAHNSSNKAQEAAA